MREGIFRYGISSEMFSCSKEEQRLSCHLPGGQGTQRSHRHNIFGRTPTDIFKGHGQGTLFIQHVIGHHQGEGSRDSKVGQKADQKWGYDAHRDRLLRVFHFLTCKTISKGHRWISKQKLPDQCHGLSLTLVFSIFPSHADSTHYLITLICSTRDP